MRIISPDNSLECHHPNNDDDRRVCVSVFVRNKQLTSTISRKGHSENTYERLLCGVFVLTNTLGTRML